MTTRMLIDATHPEETRVVVLRGHRVEEFDLETSTKAHLKGNIYLAKITRVEPSLQAAFVEYGGNRHGFLAFNEIHPDYYQIPIADREALVRAEIEAARAREAEYDRQDREEARRGRGRGERPEFDNGTATDTGADGASSYGDDHGEQDDHDHGHDDEAHDDDHDNHDHHDHEGHDHDHDHRHGSDEQPDSPEPLNADSNWTPDDRSPSTDEQAAGFTAPESPIVEGSDEMARNDEASEGDDGHRAMTESTGAPANNVITEDASPRGDVRQIEEPISVESIGGDDLDEEVRPRRAPRMRQYKIQEVIKRRQIMLVQVVKEERGNKGAALTTYISLAGRYCVLMPNTPRGGGISRKIANPASRRRLKEIVNEIEIPDGIALIVRTAGAERSKAEIKRDYEYLYRLWDDIRELTLKSSAPALIYEEADLIKRAIRDLYTKDIDDVHVAGEGAYRDAKKFMRMLMPSHAKRVQLYRDAIPLFTKHNVDAQLDAMMSPKVELRSGGYVIINQTEALVAIDVNSGRATRERNIEETAYKTNMEAAEEISRQLRLRDLAGLIVIDFIDMEEGRNNRNVERKLKECLKADRARIQVGRISHFGLLEMSRQRLRPSLMEASTEVCEICSGTGLVRSTPSSALAAMRAVEDEGLRGKSDEFTIILPTQVAIYLLNHKRDALADVERRYGVRVIVAADESLIAPQHRIERSKDPRTAQPQLDPRPALIEPELEDDLAIEDEEDVIEEEVSESGEEPARDDRGEPRERTERNDRGERDGKRRRRGRRGGRRRRTEEGAEGEAEAPNREQAATESEAAFEGDADVEDVGDEEGQIPAAEGESKTGENGEERRGRRRRRRRRRDGSPAGETETTEVVEHVSLPTDASDIDFEAHYAAQDSAAPAPPAPRQEAWHVLEPLESNDPAPRAFGDDPPMRAPVDSPEPQPVAAVAPAPVEAPKPVAPEPPLVVGESLVLPVPEAPAEEPKPRRRGWWSRG